LVEAELLSKRKRASAHALIARLSLVVRRRVATGTVGRANSGTAVGAQHLKVANDAGSGSGSAAVARVLWARSPDFSASLRITPLWRLARRHGCREDPRMVTQVDPWWTRREAGAAR
jgi:hypothetical protein